MKGKKQLFKIKTQIQRSKEVAAKDLSPPKQKQMEKGSRQSVRVEEEIEFFPEQTKDNWISKKMLKTKIKPETRVLEEKEEELVIIDSSSDDLQINGLDTFLNINTQQEMRGEVSRGVEMNEKVKLGGLEKKGEFEEGRFGEEMILEEGLKVIKRQVKEANLEFEEDVEEEENMEEEMNMKEEEIEIDDKVEGIEIDQVEGIEIDDQVEEIEIEEVEKVINISSQENSLLKEDSQVEVGGEEGEAESEGSVEKSPLLIPKYPQKEHKRESANDYFWKEREEGEGEEEEGEGEELNFEDFLLLEENSGKKMEDIKNGELEKEELQVGSEEIAVNVVEQFGKNFQQEVLEEGKVKYERQKMKDEENKKRSVEEDIGEGEEGEIIEDSHPTVSASLSHLLPTFCSPPIESQFKLFKKSDLNVETAAQNEDWEQLKKEKGMENEKNERVNISKNGNKTNKPHKKISKKEKGRELKEKSRGWEEEKPRGWGEKKPRGWGEKGEGLLNVWSEKQVKGWSIARLEAWNKRNSSPNTFFYSFVLNTFSFS